MQESKKVNRILTTSSISARRWTFSVMGKNQLCGLFQIKKKHVCLIGPRSRQSSVEVNDTPSQMNTEEVYRSLRKTTAEIQNYSFEPKLGRDTNSKDSGISQMDEQLGATVTNDSMKQNQYHASGISQLYGLNGYTRNDKEDSCNGSKTQSTATTESNTPENTVRADGEIIARNSFTAKHSNNVTFLANGELVTECKFLSIYSQSLLYMKYVTQLFIFKNKNLNIRGSKRVRYNPGSISIEH